MVRNVLNIVIFKHCVHSVYVEWFSAEKFYTVAGMCSATYTVACPLIQC